MGNQGKSVFRLVSIIAVLSLLAVPILSCGNGDADLPSDSEVRGAAREFAQSMEEAGNSTADIIDSAREEAEQWGAKAELFVETVIEELEE